MLLDNKKKKLFDEAYDAYLAINNILEGLYNEALTNPFEEDRPSITDMACSLDKYLQGILLKIAVADGTLSEEEKEFVISLPDAFDEVCSRNRGYKRFIKAISVERYQEDKEKYFTEDEYPEFLQMIKDEDEGQLDRALVALETILNAFAAIDDHVSDCESEIVTRTSTFLREKTGTKRNGDTFIHIGTPVTASNKKSPASPMEERSKQGEEVEEAMKELDELVGLDNVKQEVLSSINLLKINNMRKEKGLPELQTSKHMVFTGQPGTGKTTVARILAKIYKGLGVVSKGHLVETDRSGMVAGYVGQTALKTAQVIKKAKGGVLFIDEAYALNSKEGSNDFGKEAIDTLVKGMEDYRDDLVVIVAGYSGDMNRFISMNPGLRSRFNKYIKFDNYEGSEMLEIFKGMCEKAEFILSPGAEKKALDYFNKKQGDRLFGNARGVRNYFEGMINLQASRIINIKDFSEEEFRTILEEDLIVTDSGH